MMKLSAIIISKNAEQLIADCMDSVSFCDEILVFDDGSTEPERLPIIKPSIGVKPIVVSTL